MQLNSAEILSDLQAKLEKYVMSQANCRWGKLIVIFSILIWSGVFTIIFTNSKAASWRNQMFHEETNLKLKI
jgi:hypothetical protein